MMVSAFMLEQAYKHDTEGMDSLQLLYLLEWNPM